jgi:hypothetical protein
LVSETELAVNPVPTDEFCNTKQRIDYEWKIQKLFPSKSIIFENVGGKNHNLVI